MNADTDQPRRRVAELRTRSAAFPRLRLLPGRRSSGNPARRNFLAGGIAALGLGAQCAGAAPGGSPSASAGSEGASTCIIIMFRRFRPPSMSKARHGAPPKWTPQAIARRHGQGRRDEGRAVAGAARRLVRRRRGGPQARARVQRLRRAARQGSSGPLRPVRRAAAAGHRRQPARDRVRARRAQGRRHRPVHELRRQIPRRPGLRAGFRGAEPAQGGGLYSSAGAGLLQPA